VRIRLAAQVAVFMALALTAACTSDGPGEDPTGTPAPSPTPDLSLDVAVYGDPATLEAYQQIADAFEASRPEITVRLRRTPSWTAADKALTIATDSGLAPDVFLADHVGLASLVAQERVAPVGDLLVEREIDFGDGYQRLALTAFSANAALQCMPNDVTPAVVFYNPDLIRLRRLVPPGDEPPSAAVGWNWEEFRGAARQAQRAGAKGVYVPADLDIFGALVTAAGGSLSDDARLPTMLELGSEDSAEAVGIVLDLLRNRNLSPTSEELAAAGPVQRFVTGRLAMLVGTRSLVPQLRSSGIDFDVMPMPHIDSTEVPTFMNGWCLTPDADNMDLAADFIAFAVGDTGASIAAESGAIVPSNTTVLASDSFTRPGLSPANGFVFLDSVQRSKLPPYAIGWESVRTAASPFLEKLYFGPATAIATLLAELDELSVQLLTPQEAGADS
jgi:multiple sugar transport system substrate-binding protein